jgi:hypothetical protein
MEAATIHPDAFHERMRSHWETTLGNVYSPRIGEQWVDLARTFNAHVEDASNPQGPQQYSVVAAPLGTGKTQGLILYCVLLSEKYGDEAPGVLIITRLTRDADGIEEQINRMAGRTVALAYHHVARRERDVKLNDVSRYPVAIITHAAYRDALIQLGQPSGQSKWPMFSTYATADRDEQRALNVIDEALDMVEHDNVGIEKLKKTLGHIPERVQKAHREEIAALEETVEHMRSLSAAANVEEPGPILADKKPAADRPRLHHMVLKGKPISLSELLAQLNCTRLRDCDENQTQRMIGDTLHSVEVLWQQWCFASKLPTGEDALHTARDILPKSSRGAVILDATSRANRMYDLLGDRIVRRRDVAGVRSWKNVKLHVSAGHKVGKGFVARNADKWASEGVSELQKALGEAPRNVLLIGHSTGEPLLKKYAPDGWHTAHWGAIDGSNEWRDCDTVAIFSLPYRPDYWAANTYFALTGDLNESVLSEDGSAKRWSLKLGQVVSDVVQAIGRVRCRKVIDAEGNCAPTDVFLTLPVGTIADQILAGIVAELPDVDIHRWRFDKNATGAKKKTSKNEEALVDYCSKLTRGTHDAALARQRLNLRGGSWLRLARDLKDRSSIVAAKLAEMGVMFRVEGKRSMFIRA